MKNPASSLPTPAEIGGLTASEAERRRRAGQSNLTPKQATRSVGRIIADNCLTLFNLVNVALAAMLVVFGEPRQILFLGVALCSTAMGIVQELRAKRTLDRLAILSRDAVSLVRDGKLIQMASEDIVLGDTVALGAGDQVTVDGACVHALGLEMNEALVTGEADEVGKSPGDAVLSGSFVTAGTAYIRATAVGKDSFAARLSVEARREKSSGSRIMRMLRGLVTVLAISILPVGAILLGAKLLGGMEARQAAVGTAGALVGMIPQGLILLTNIAFAVGVVNLGKRQVLVQSLPCIETLARVDTLCLDKTGTITSGALAVSGIVPADGYTERDMRAGLAALLAALPDNNQTARALKNEFLKPGAGSPPLSHLDVTDVVEVIPFSSSRKYGGVRFADRSLFLGAAAFVLPTDPSLAARAGELSRGGRRTLLLASGEGLVASRGIGFVLLEDTVRENARGAFDYFQQQEITLKVISGDDPVTVSGVADRAGLPGAGDVLDLSAYASGADESQSLRLTSEDTRKTVFGRVSPYQKRTLVRLMRENGHTVAMTGDGVNDVLALKEADCGVAMADGSAAVRNAADLVLLSSDFSQMIPAVHEGRRVINNIEKVAALYLSKTIFSTVLALLFIFIPGEYPFTPIQLTLLGALTIGIPSFVLTLKPNYRRIQGDLIRRVVSDAIPNALAIVLSVLAVRCLALVWTFGGAEISMLNTLVTGALGFYLLYRVTRPLDAVRALLLCGLSAVFLGAFVLFPAFFDFPDRLGWPALLAVPLVVLGFTWAWLFGKLCKMITQNR